MPVVQAEPRDFNLPTDHPMHLGFDPGLARQGRCGDAIDSVCRGCRAITNRARTPRSSTSRSIRWQTRYPFREIEGRSLIAGVPLAALTMLRECLAETMQRQKERPSRAAARRSPRCARRSSRKRKKLIETVKDQTPIHPAWLAALHQPGKVQGCHRGQRTRRAAAHARSGQGRALTWAAFCPAASASVSAPGSAPSLQRRSARSIVTVGDGSYMFGNPIPYHYVARAENLPTLTVIANNQSWLAVRQSTLDVYPDRSRRQGQRHAAHRAQAVARLSRR